MMVLAERLIKVCHHHGRFRSVYGSRLEVRVKCVQRFIMPVIVLLIKPFVWWHFRCRCRCRRYLLKVLTICLITSPFPLPVKSSWQRFRARCQESTEVTRVPIFRQFQALTTLCTSHEFENSGFNLNTHQMFSFQTTQSLAILHSRLSKTRVVEYQWLSWSHRFTKIFVFILFSVHTYTQSRHFQIPSV